jgi:hypothetical protein
MIDGDDCGAVGGMNEWQGKLKYWENTCSIAALGTTDPPVSNPCRGGGKPATDRLRYGTADIRILCINSQVLTVDASVGLT